MNRERDEERGKMTVEEAGRLGGEKRRDDGADYAAMGREGGKNSHRGQNQDRDEDEL